jgi:16S rRNA (cytosine967-C5)-methyltransferase
MNGSQENNLINNNASAHYDEPVSVNPSRLAAVKIITRFERSDAYIDKLMFKEMKDGNLSPHDKALLKELVNGVIRWRWKLDWVLTGFYRGDYLKCLNVIKNALRVGLYQILFLDKIPVHAAINEAVETVKRIQGEKIAGVVNGVLRNISRNIQNIRYPVYEEDHVYFYTIMESHPRWMIRRWFEIFGEENTVKLLIANNERPNTVLRVNSKKANINDIKKELGDKDIFYEISPYLEDSLLIKSRGVNISALDMFTNGLVAVQDTSAALATKLSHAKPGDKILDLCAAPGGKSFGLADQTNDSAEIIAVDKYPSKLRFIEEGAERLGLTSIKTMEADVLDSENKNAFDVVFVDAPCSGLGTLARKPDIKWKRDKDDIPLIVNTQKEILEKANLLVKPGGILVYSTCTIEPEENEKIVMAFIELHPEYEIDPADKYLPGAVCSNGFMQTFPHLHGMDGAFAAR